MHLPLTNLSINVTGVLFCATASNSVFYYIGNNFVDNKSIFIQDLLIQTNDNKDCIWGIHFKSNLFLFDICKSIGKRTGKVLNVICKTLTTVI